MTLMLSTAHAQINAGEQKPDPNVPFTMTQVATFNLPWRMAFLSDGRMLVTEKVGPIWLVTPDDGKPARDNPNYGKTGAPSVGVINPPSDTEAAKTAPVVYTYKFPGKNLTPSETWITGHRTPYGLAFGPDGRLWEMEHGPRGGDELTELEQNRHMAHGKSMP